MATTYRLKRKLYFDSDDMKKTTLGGLAIGGAFLGAKRGMFGNMGRMAAGRIQMGAGKAFNSRGIYKGGATSYSKGFVGEVNKLNNNSLTKGQFARGAATVRSNLMKNFPKVATNNATSVAKATTNAATNTVASTLPSVRTNLPIR